MANCRVPLGIRVSLVSVLLLTPFARAQNDSQLPVSVCEVFRDLPANLGKTVVVLGRFSFRENGRSLNEAKCADSPNPVVLDVVYDPKSAPKPDGALSVEASAVYKKLAEVKTSTTLGKARFGSPDYDRWAFVYGRVEEAPPPSTRSTSSPAAKPGSARRARLVCTGDALVVFVAEPGS